MQGGEIIDTKRVAKQPDGTWRWACRIDTDYHKEQAKAGYWAVAVIVGFVFLIGIIIAAQNRAWDTLWIPLLVSGVVLFIALPLLHLSSNASEPMEEYWMTEIYVKAGYGRSAVFTHFQKVASLTVFPDHIELIEKGKQRRIYVPSEDLDFVADYMIDHLSSSAVITRYS